MSTLSPASEEQLACVEAVLAGFNVQVEASAGAGKSTTFYHTAKAFLSKYPDAPVLLVCFNTVLRAEAMRKVSDLQLNMDCFTVHALAAAMYHVRVSDTLSLYNAVHGTTIPTSPAQYALVLIDEAQDLNEDHAEVLNALQKVLHAPMQYMIVGDPRQEIYAQNRSFSSTLMAEPSKYLVANGREWKKHILNTSYRLTAPVCHLLNNCFRDSDTQVAILPGNTRSKAIQPMYIVGDKDQNDLMGILKIMLSKYSPGDIMILAPTVALTKHRCQRLAYSLHTELHVSIFSTHKQRSDLTPAMMQGKIFLSTYHQSKGYERPCVLVLGVDEHEYELNQSPATVSGKPMVHNSLHVALTRAQEMLIVFQHYQCGAYPTLKKINLHEFADVQMLRTPCPRPAPPRSTTGEISDQYLTSFQPRSTLTRLLESIQLENKDDDTSNAALSICKVTPDSGEDVMDAYLEAILSFAERQHTIRASRLERCIKDRIHSGQVPKEFASAVQSVHQNEAPKTAKDWIALSIVYNAMICHDYPHELYQVRHLNWVGQQESVFVNQSAADILHQLPKTAGFWHEQATRMLQNRPIRAKVPFVAYLDSGPQLYQFTLNESFTEQNLLLAMVHMWVFRAAHAYVYSISSNKLYTIQAPDDLNTFLNLMLTTKLAKK